MMKLTMNAEDKSKIKIAIAAMLLTLVFPACYFGLTALSRMAPSDQPRADVRAALSPDACAAVVAANSQAGILTSINEKVIVYEQVEASAVKPLCNLPGNAVAPLPSSTNVFRRATVPQIPQELCQEVAGVLSMNRDGLIRVNGQRVLQGHPDQASALNFCRQGRNDVEVTWGPRKPTALPSWPTTTGEMET